MNTKRDMGIADTNKAIDSAVERLIQDFKRRPGCYFTEEDVRWQLMKEIDHAFSPLTVSMHSQKAASLYL